MTQSVDGQAKTKLGIILCLQPGEINQVKDHVFTEDEKHHLKNNELLLLERGQGFVFQIPTSLPVGFELHYLKSKAFDLQINRDVYSVSFQFILV